jgi:hypothetical protein
MSVPDGDPGGPKEKPEPVTSGFHSFSLGSHRR